MRNILRRISTPGALSVARPAWAVALCLVWGASCAFAQDKPAQDKPAAEKTDQQQPAEAKPETDKPKGNPKAAQSERVAPSPKSGGAKAKRAKSQRGKAGCGAAKKKGRGKVDMTPNPNAKWACAEQTVTLTSAWRGQKLNFNFKIRNEGTAALHIQAKGG